MKLYMFVVLNLLDSSSAPVVLKTMLDSFIGTLDQHGLRSLKSEIDQPHSFVERLPGRFWAILDRSVVPSINQAIAKGDSRSALQILLQQAREIGGI